MDEPFQERFRPLRMLGALRRLPGKVLWRFALFLGIIALGVAVILGTPIRDHLTHDAMAEFFGHVQDSWWSPLVFLATFVVVSLLGLPVSPLVLAGGIAFGAMSGMVYNTLGMFLGSAASYFLAIVLGREFVLHLAGSRLKQVELAFERSGFWPLVQTRFLPIPFALVNYGAALAGVKPYQFLLSTAIGLVPATFMHTYFASALFHAPENRDRLRLMIWYGACWAVMALVTSLPAIRQALQRRRKSTNLKG